MGKKTGKCFLISCDISRGFIHRFSMPGEHPPEIKNSDTDRHAAEFFRGRIPQNLVGISTNPVGGHRRLPETSLNTGFAPDRGKTLENRIFLGTFEKKGPLTAPYRARNSSRAIRHRGNFPGRFRQAGSLSPKTGFRSRPPRKHPGIRSQYLEGLRIKFRDPFKTTKWHDSHIIRLPSVASLSAFSTMNGFVGRSR